MPTIEPFALEALRAIEPITAQVVYDHEAAQRLWLPSELIPEHHEFPALSPEVTGMLVLNLLTEDGLPYFTATLVKHLGDENAIWDWNRLWTAEEDRHGSVIKLYLQHSLRREQQIAVERLQYDYLRSGFRPNFSNDPFQLFAYVVLQESATQISHAGIARQARSEDPVLQKLLGRVSGEEAKHHQAYLRLFIALMQIMPSHAVESLATVIKRFQMPGHEVVEFEQLAILQQRLGAFGPGELAEIIDKVWRRLNLGNLGGLNAEAEKARDYIDRSRKLLQKKAERAARVAKREVHLHFLNQTVTV